VGGARFPRRARLSKRGEFQAVFRDAVKIFTPALTLLVKRNGLGYPRLGLAISKKHAPSAVVRNRVKRMTREGFRLHQERLGAVDVVALARPGVARLDRQQLRAQLDTLWARLIEQCETF